MRTDVLRFHVLDRLVAVLGAATVANETRAAAAWALSRACVERTPVTPCLLSVCWIILLILCSACSG